MSRSLMAVRAECVMLNKGSHIEEAMAALDDILKRMGAHQSKNFSLLRPLRSWSNPARSTVHPVEIGPESRLVH
jgi:pyruvate kinase